MLSFVTVSLEGLGLNYISVSGNFPTNFFSRNLFLNLVQSIP